MQNFRQLKVWERGHELTLAVYRATEAFPRAETYGLVSQMRRSAASIPTNIAEGCGRGGWPELINFSQIAYGSLSELDYQLLLARDLSYLDAAAYGHLSEEVLNLRRMLGAFISGLRIQSGRGRATRRAPAGRTNAAEPYAESLAD